MSLLSIISLSLGAVLAENIVLTRFLGVSSFVDSSRDVKTAVRSGVALTILLALAAPLACILNWAIIHPLGLEYLRTVIFVLVLAVGVRAVEVAIYKKSPELSEKLGISLSFVAANAALLGAMLITVNADMNILEALVFGIFAGAGFTMAISLFAAVRAHLKYCDIPRVLQGEPIVFITAGLIALAFMGFSGMKFI